MNNRICELLIAATVTMCSCSESYFMFDDELPQDYYKIAESKAYIDYKLSEYYFRFAGKENKSNKYIDITYEYTNLMDKYNILLRLFPEYESFNKEIKTEMLRIAAQQNEKLYELAKKDIANKPFTRASNDNYESKIVYNHFERHWEELTSYFNEQQHFRTCQEALDNCKNYTTEETGGFVFTDNSALWLRTVGSSYKHFNINYIPTGINGSTLEGVFHYHPDGSVPSEADYYSALNLKSLYGITYSIVYSQDRIYKRWF